MFQVCSNHVQEMSKNVSHAQVKISAGQCEHEGVGALFEGQILFFWAVNCVAFYASYFDSVQVKEALLIHADIESFSIEDFVRCKRSSEGEYVVE